MSNHNWKRARISLYAFLIAWFACCWIVFLLVFGSGILPIPLSLLFLSTAPLAAVCAVVFALVPARRRSLAGGVLAFVAFILAGKIFMVFVIGGFTHAKAYGTQLVSCIQSHHDVHGTWPSSIDDISPHSLPTIDIPGMAPYLVFVDGNQVWKIGGFFISYGLNEPNEPRLEVGRREMRATWDWNAKTWAE